MRVLRHGVAFFTANLLMMGSGRLIRTQHELMPGRYGNESNFTLHADNKTSTCGMDGGIHDCKNVDYGACGNACCIVDVPLDSSALEAHETLKKFLSEGGASGSFAFVNSTSELGALDPEFKFFLQGTHTTSGRNYIDTLNFNIRQTSTTSCRVRAFSMSDLQGSLSDKGQNFKTLKYMFENMYRNKSSMEIVYGCGRKENVPSPPKKENVSSSNKYELVSMPPEDRSSKNVKETHKSTCGQASDHECDKIDQGSCGSACCVVDVTLSKHPTVIYNAVKEFFKAGGDNGAYKYIPGDMPHAEHPPDDVRAAEIDMDRMQFQYVMKANHTGTDKITDELNFNIRSTKDNEESILRVFAISKNPAALSDRGQNFKSIIYMTNDLSIDRSNVKVLHGCGPHHVKSGTSMIGLTGLVVAVFASFAAREW